MEVETGERIIAYWHLGNKYVPDNRINRVDQGGLYQEAMIGYRSLIAGVFADHYLDYDGRISEYLPVNSDLLTWQQRDTLKNRANVRTVTVRPDQIHHSNNGERDQIRQSVARGLRTVELLIRHRAQSVGMYATGDSERCVSDAFLNAGRLYVPESDFDVPDAIMDLAGPRLVLRQ